MVLIDTDRLGRSDLGTITGPIWIECPDAEPFPERGWDDIIVPVLTWWTEALVQLRQQGGRKSCNVHFMDGPYKVILYRDEPSIGIELIRDRGERPVVEGISSGDPDQMLADAVAAGARLMHEIRVRDWESTDSEGLRFAVDRGKELLRRSR